MVLEERDFAPRPGGSCVLFAIIAIFLAIASPARAVPAYARRTGLDCISCHIGGSSSLTELGRDFQMRGHRLKSDSEARIRFADLPGYATFAAKIRHQDKTGRATTDNLQTTGLLVGGPINRSLGFHAEYTLYDRLPYSTDNTSGFLDAYLQYATDTAKDAFWFARVGRLHPYAINALGTGARIPQSRARVVGESLGGLVPSPQRRTLGASGGFSGPGGVRVEAGAQQGVTSDGSFARPDLFASVEKNVDEAGSGFGVYGRSGWRGTETVNTRFTETGFFGRWLKERYMLTGAVFGARTRDDGGAARRPTGYFLQASANVLATTTGYVRLDDVAGDALAGPRSRGLAVGVTQRVPGSGRVVLEYGDSLTGAGRPRSVVLDLVLMY